MLFEILGNLFLAIVFMGVLLIGAKDSAKQNNRTVWEELLDED